MISGDCKDTVAAIVYLIYLCEIFVGFCPFVNRQSSCYLRPIPPERPVNQWFSEQAITGLQDYTLNYVPHWGNAR